jgi:pimeloyl-ACP methyl ester carboxylesterase
MSLPPPALGPAFRSRREQAGVPHVTVTLAVRAHVAADKATLATFRRLRKPPSDDAWDRIVKEAHLARDHFARAGWLDDLRSYHGVPEPLTNPQLRPSRVARLRVERMKFPSTWTPPADVPGRERWLSYNANTFGRATVLRHRDEQRPWVVCIHGTEMGRDTDLRSFRARHLFEDLGCNVVLPILPLHGPRREPKGSTGQFPSIDPLDNVHGLAQAAHDVRRIIGWIRTQSPSAIAVQGVSLGGYVAARAGVAAGIVAVFLIVAWGAIDGVAANPVGWIGRVAPIMLLGFLVGRATDRLRAAAQTRQALFAAQLREREAAEINDSVIQGLAAAKWSIEAGQIERGLDALTDTIATTESLVAALLRNQPLPQGSDPARQLSVPASSA